MNQFFLIIACGDDYTYSSEQYVPVVSMSKEDAILAIDQILDEYVQGINDWLTKYSKLDDQLKKLDQDAKDFYDKYMVIHKERSALVRPELKISGHSISNDDFIEFGPNDKYIKKDDYYLNVASIEKLFKNAQILSIK